MGGRDRGDGIYLILLDVVVRSKSWLGIHGSNRVCYELDCEGRSCSEDRRCR